MTEDPPKRPIWDLEQYHVSARGGDGGDDAPRPRRGEGGVEEIPRPWAEDAGPAAGGGEGGGSDGPPRGAVLDDGFYLEPGEEKTRARYVNSGTLFMTALGAAFLTILTLGLYRFWMITRIRRLYCSSIRVDNDPLEYTGAGFEKFVGFLIAVIVLAAYLALANIGLLFLGIVAGGDEAAFIPFSAIAIVPFLFWAAYRGQRYVMARLRWRGIRFGLRPGAWGYTMRSLLWSVAVALSAGLLWPYMHFKQAKYIADRSHFGDLPVRQEGSWLGLLSYWIWLYIGVVLMFLFVWGLAEEMQLEEEGIGIMLMILLPFFLVIFYLLFMNYQVGSFRYLWDNRVIGDSRLDNDVGTWPIIWQYFKGTFLVGLLTSIAIGVIVMITTGLGIALGYATPEEGLAIMQDAETGEIDPGALMPFLPFIAAIGFAYLSAFAFSYAFTQVFLIQPLLRLRVESVLIRNPKALREAAQRRHDPAAEAGGFADALGVDVGAGFG